MSLLPGKDILAYLFVLMCSGTGSSIISMTKSVQLHASRDVAGYFFIRQFCLNFHKHLGFFENVWALFDKL